MDKSKKYLIIFIIIPVILLFSSASFSNTGQTSIDGSSSGAASASHSSANCDITELPFDGIQEIEIELTDDFVYEDKSKVQACMGGPGCFFKNGSCVCYKDYGKCGECVLIGGD